MEQGCRAAEMLTILKREKFYYSLRVEAKEIAVFRGHGLSGGRGGHGVGKRIQVSLPS